MRLNFFQETIFQSFFDNLTEPRIIVKANPPEFTVVACNRPYRMVSHTLEKDIIGKSIKEIHPTEKKDEVNAGIIQAGLNKALVNNEAVKLDAVRFDIPNADGTSIEQSWWQAEYLPICGESGRVEYLMCTTYNITEQITGLEAVKKSKEQEQALQRELALNNELAATNKKLFEANQELQQWQQGLELLVQELEARVEIRTQELAESEAKARYIIDDAPVAICVLAGKELVIETANNEMMKLWGKSKNIICMPLQRAIPELETQLVFQILEEVYVSGKPYFGNEEKVFFEINGRLKEFYFNFVYNPLIDTSEETKRIIVVAHNVTEQVVARKALEKARDLLKLAIDAAGIGVWQVDLSTGIFTFSEQGRIMYGIPEGLTLTLTDATSLVDEEYREQVIRNIEEAIETKEKFEHVYLIRPMDNSKPKWLKSVGKIYYNEHGIARYATGTILDITRQQEDDIRKNDFIGMVSHELKTPLTTLNAYVQLLQLRLNQGDDQFATATLEKIRKQVKKMTAMISSFLNVSRLESAKIQVVKKQFVLQELINDAIDDSTLITSSDNITLIPCGTITVYADRDKIYSVISNLLSNALKYSPKGKPIEIKCEQKENMVLVSLRDQGIGIEQQHLEKLFDRFYRVESVLTKTISGFGIGLYLCAEIINQHGGKIWVESEPEKGSTFYFSLPLAE